MNASLPVMQQLQSISLARNSLSTLVNLAPAALIRYLPKIQNLSLEGNAISQVRLSFLAHAARTYRSYHSAPE